MGIWKINIERKHCVIAYAMPTHSVHSPIFFQGIPEPPSEVACNPRYFFCLAANDKKAVCFGEALKPEFKTYQEQVVKNAKALAEAMVEEGFNLVSGGTDNHLILVDLQNMNITGKELQNRLDEVYITVNKNAVPNDPASPFVTSGVRIGTPAVTTRGLKEEDMKTIAKLIKMNHTEQCTDKL